MFINFHFSLFFEVESAYYLFDSLSQSTYFKWLFFIYRSGDLKMSIALQTVEYMSTEDNFLPYSAASGELLYVEDMLERTALFGAFSVRKNLYLHRYKQLTLTLL